MHPIPFTGRHSELHFLRTQLDQAAESGTRLVLISAPSGAGKTALVRQFLQTSAALPHASGRGWDNRAAFPFQPLREAVRQLVEKQPHLSVDHPDLAPFRNYLDPFLQPREAAILSPPPVPLLFTGLRQLFVHAARSTLCIFLDDLQWADEGTFDWLDFTLREMREVPVLWIGAYRSDERPLAQPLLDRQLEWRRSDRFHSFALSPLSPADVEELVRQSIPASMRREGLTAQIWQRSEGLALLAVEEIRRYCEDEVSPSAGSSLIQHRLEQLAQDDRDLLAQAAVAGERFDLEPLAQALQQDALEIGQRLALLVDKRMLIPDENGFRFAHSRYREIVLENTPPALRKLYHGRLIQTPVTTDPVDRLYHLIESGETELSIEGLIQEGDRALGLMDWRDAMRFYVEAQQLAQDESLAPLRSHIFERLGYVHHSILREPAIARGYFEAGLNWTTSAREKILLLCRIAATFQPGPQFLDYLERARQVVPEDPALWGPIHLLQSGYDLHIGNLSQARRLVRQTQVSQLPPDLVLQAQRQRLNLARTQGDREELQHQLEILDHDAPPGDTWTHAHQLHARASVCFALGHWQHSLDCLQQAVVLFQSLGRQSEASRLMTEMGQSSLFLGLHEKARTFLRQTLRVSPKSSLDVYRFLCKSWLADRCPEGVEWAAGYLRAYVDNQLENPPDKGSNLGKFAHRLGWSELIYHYHDGQEDFNRTLETQQERLMAAGYAVEGSWRFDRPVELPEIPIPVDPQTFSWTPGNEQGDFTWEGPLVMRTPPLRGFYKMDMPRLLHPVSGDFALQVKLPGAEEIIAATLHCQEQLRSGQRADRAPAGGGLLIMRNQRDGLRILAHLQTPGEVICLLRQGEQERFLGRGLAADGPVYLRVERRGKTLSAYATNTPPHWYLCGQVELPDWEEVEIGLFAECLIDLYEIVEQAEIHFSGIYLETSAPLPAPSLPQPRVYPFPTESTHPLVPDMVVADPRMRQLLEQVQALSRATLPVLIQGETGTGKERVARALHALSPKSQGPFVPLNCAAIAPELLERELFGHVRGAFTGAYEQRGGLFEAAHGGVLFLDEISEATPAFQARLLRAIEEGAIRRVGETRMRSVDVRVVTATNRNLRQRMEEGHFRRDLYFRLAGANLQLPPLRQRPEEIPHLAYFVLDQWCRRHGTAAPAFSQDAMERLQAHPWPGNVRELIHTVERALIGIGEETLVLPRHIYLEKENDRGTKVVPQEEQARIEAALRATGGNRSAAARHLGMGRATLYRKLRQYGITL